MQIIWIFIFTIALTTPSFGQDMPEDDSAIRILAYFIVGQDDRPQANIRTTQFEAHIKTLKNESAVLPLPQIISIWEQSTPLPNKTTAITFDGGHRSILTNALPVLLEHQIPFTVFIAPDLANIGAPQYLSWADIKKLQKTGLATIGMHPSSYSHYRDIEQFTKDLNNARARFREKLGEIPKLFSFSFGKYDEATIKLIQNQGFTAFGQQSGVAYKNDNALPLPRFTMTEKFSNETRLNMIIGALPLPVTDITLQPLGFTATQGNKNITCYSNNDAGIMVEKINAGRVEIRPNEPISPERLRINCTQKTSNNQMRWLGFLVIKNINGQ